jgi:hypothetical protein
VPGRVNSVGKGNERDGVGEMCMLGGRGLIARLYLGSVEVTGRVRVILPSWLAYSVRKSDQCASFPPK